MRRSEARELAFTVLFEMDYHRELSPLEAVEEAVEGRELSRSAYFMRLVTGTAGQMDAIDEIIGQNAIGWRVSRISRVSLAILRLALYEMLFVEEIPHSIAINEAVELAKRYESKEAAVFINGVLGSVAKSHPKPEPGRVADESTVAPSAEQPDSALAENASDAGESEPDELSVPSENAEDAPVDEPEDTFAGGDAEK